MERPEPEHISTSYVEVEFEFAYAFASIHAPYECFFKEAREPESCGRPLHGVV
jgi:hypothetical protein